MLGIDLSNYQSQFSAADAIACKAAGVGFAFIGRQQVNTWAPQQAQFCRDAGIIVAEYLESLGGEWPELFPDTEYVGIAIERNPDGTGDSGITDKQDIINCVNWVRQQGRKPLAYTRQSAWVDVLGLGDWTWPADNGVPVWAAYYRRSRTPNGRVLPVPFGGWTENLVDQYSEVGRIPGIDYDIDMDEAPDNMWVVSEPVNTTSTGAGEVTVEPEPEPVSAYALGSFTTVPPAEAVALLNDLATVLGPIIGASDSGITNESEFIARVKSPEVPPGMAWVLFQVKEERADGN